VKKRSFLHASLALLAAASTCSALAQPLTPLKFQLDWRFEGPAALFVHPEQKGYFKQAGLDVTVEAASGAGAIQRVASGTHDLGFADLAALMEFHANNPDAPIKPVAIMVIYNTTPASVMALKKSGITKASDLTGKKMGAPIFDAGRRTFPIFAQANGVGAVQWTTMDPPLRETMLVRGDLDAVTGYTFTSLLNLEARGIKAEDVVVLPYATHGVQLYGNVIIASPKLIAEKPEAVRAFLKAFAKGAKDRTPGPDGRAGGQGLRNQEPRARPGGLERQLSAQRCRAGHPPQALTPPPAGRWLRPALLKTIAPYDGLPPRPCLC